MLTILFKILGMGTLMLSICFIIGYTMAFISDHNLQWIYVILGLIVLLGTLGCGIFGLF
jgi:hypothetical protein